MILDVATYNMYKDLALANQNSWRISQRHNLESFSMSFPVHLNNLRQTRQIMDTMQESRFDVYMEELGGLTEEELELYVNACLKIVNFQLSTYPGGEVILPLSTLLSAFIIYEKITTLKKDFNTALEIGPGCGYLSLFMSDHDSLDNYSQIEVCDSLYLLQNLLNSHLYRSEFEQKVYNKEGEQSFNYPLPEWPEKYNIRNVGHFEAPNSIDIDVPKKCTQYPWWKIGDLLNSEKKFDVVTSNANLCEFSESALHDYLMLINEKLDRDGIFYVSCFGGQIHATVPVLFEKLYDFGFAPLFIIRGNKFNENLDKKFCVGNGVFVNRNHSDFKKYYNRKNFSNYFNSEEDIIQETFGKIKRNRKKYTQSEIKNIIIKLLKEE